MFVARYGVCADCSEGTKFCDFVSGLYSAQKKVHCCSYGRARYHNYLPLGKQRFKDHCSATFCGLSVIGEMVRKGIRFQFLGRLHLFPEEF